MLRNQHGKEWWLGLHITDDNKLRTSGYHHTELNPQSASSPAEHSDTTSSLADTLAIAH